MSDLSLYIRISRLPDHLKSELKEYLDSLLSKRFKKKSTNKKHPVPGCMKGTFQIMNGFDEPLEDFKE
jgi:hypothetical protein